MLRYTLKQLQYLIACIDHQSIAQAAKVMNVSQPTISIAITKLEDSLGVQLLFRHTSSGVSATKHATRIVDSARQLLEDATQLQQEAQMIGTEISGKVHLGSFSTLAPMLLPSLIRKISLEHPKISLKITEGTQEELLNALKNGHIDMALLYDVELSADIATTPLLQRKPYVLLPKEHPLSQQAKISLAELVNQPMVLLDIPPSRQFFLKLFSDAGLSPLIAYSSPSIELVRGMVGQGLGYTILVTQPKSNHTYDGEEVLARPLHNCFATSTVVFAQLANTRRTALTEAVRKIAVASQPF